MLAEGVAPQGVHADILCAELNNPSLAVKDSTFGVATYKWVQVQSIGPKFIKVKCWSLQVYQM